jgi:beta-galactosidase GanA
MEVGAFQEVFQPRPVIEGGPRVPALTLATLNFHRDSILAFFAEQALTLREAGVKQWITTDWNSLWLALADDPKAKESLDWAGLNFYPPSREDPAHWTQLAWQEDKQRAAHGLDRFFITETRFGVAGDTATWDAAPVQEQFRMWVLQPVAFGASGLLFWSGNRWHGGHWPHWGGLLDWTGQPEPDFPWGIQMGELFQKWGRKLLEAPVQSSVAVLTDFDQRAALQVYPHTASSKQLLGESFDLFHRLGLGVDSLSLEAAQQSLSLGRYQLIVVAANPVLEGSAVPKSLKGYVEAGGNLLITPFTAYQDRDGIFRNDGFGANLVDLTGTLVRTVRRMGSRADGEGWPDQKVEWCGKKGKSESLVGIDGFCEFLEVQPGTDVIARFRSNEKILEGKPAATMKKLGKGTVIKLAFWPADDSLTSWLQELAPPVQPFLTRLLPRGFQAVPRKDKSLFIVNTTRKPASLLLGKPALDRFTGKKYQGEIQMNGFGVLWLAEGP